MVEARHYLADDEGTPLVYFDGEDFYIGEPWDVRGPRPGELLMRDEFGLVNIADKDLIRRDVTYLENVLEDAAEYINNEQLPGWVWYHWQTKGEAMKRALVYGGLVNVPGRGRMRTPNMQADTLEPVLQLDRHRFFETPEIESFISDNFSPVGGVLAVTPGGTADGRVHKLEIDAVTMGAFRRLWAGFRETGMGVDDFAPIWDLHDGTALTDASKVSPDADAYNNHCIEVSFAAVGANAVRARIKLSDAIPSGDGRHMMGQYLVLLRWSGTSGKEFGITLAHRISSQAGSDAVLLEKNYVLGAGTGTYNALPLGIMSIPSIGGKQNWSSNQLGEQTIEIYAELVNGTIGDDLRLNTLTFIPAVRSLKASGMYVDGNQVAAVRCLPTDRFVGWNENESSELPVGNIDIAAPQFYVPRNGGILVAAGGWLNSQPHDGALNLTLEVARRWRTYRRGGEASW